MRARMECSAILPSMPDANLGDGASRTPAMPLVAQEVRAAAQDCGFPLVGLAQAAPLDPAPLVSWIEHGYCADLASMRKRIEERLNPAAVVPGAQTVIVLGIPYGPGEASAPPRPAIARDARGRPRSRSTNPARAHRPSERSMKAPTTPSRPRSAQYSSVICVQSPLSLPRKSSRHVVTPTALASRIDQQYPNEDRAKHVGTLPID